MIRFRNYDEALSTAYQCMTIASKGIIYYWDMLEYGYERSYLWPEIHGYYIAVSEHHGYFYVEWLRTREGIANNYGYGLPWRFSQYLHLSDLSLQFDGNILEGKETDEYEFENPLLTLAEKIKIYNEDRVAKVISVISPEGKVIFPEADSGVQEYSGWNGINLNLNGWEEFMYVVNS